MTSTMGITDGQGQAASNQFLGQYSGITNSTIDSLIQADSVPMNNLQNQVATIQGQEAAWGDIRTSLNNFLTDVQALQNPATLNGKVATSSDSSIATISGDDTSQSGDHEIIVKQLATSSKLTGGRVNVTDSQTSLNFSGNLTLSLAGDTKAPALTGTDGSSIDNPAFTLPTADSTVSEPDDGNTSTPGTVTVNIKPTDSLTTIIDKVNSQTKQSGITASIVDNHLVFTSTQDGAATISASDDSGSNSLVNNLQLGSNAAKLSEGQAAVFSLDGLSIARNTNNVTDVLNGATITLAGVSSTSTNTTTDTTGKSTTTTSYNNPTTLSLADDTKTFEGAVNTMVGQYNSLMGLISNDLDAGDPSQAGNQQGALVGDSTLSQLQEQLEDMMTETSSSADTNSKYTTADSVGISFIDKNGTLGLDSTTFEAALKDNPQAVKDFFYKADTDAVTGISSNQSGYATDLATLSNTYLATSTGNQGIIASVTTDMDSTINDLNSQISDFQDQLTQKRAEYVQEYSNLDTFQATANSQLQYLQSQLSSLG